MLNDRTILDHGADFKWPKLHRFLHLIKEIREQVGADSFDYEQVILKLARYIANVSDWNEESWPPEEVYHYFEGEHKPDWERAVDFLMKYEKMNVDEDRNSSWTVRNTADYTNPSKPGMSEGFNVNTNAEDWSPANPSYDYMHYASRPDAEIYLERHPWDYDESLIEKLRSNEYFNMIFNRQR